MAGGGFWGGLAGGIEQGQRLVQNAKRQEMLDAEEADRNRARNLRDSRDADVSIAVAEDNRPARAGEEGPVPEVKRPAWESLDKASQRRLQGGDLDGYEAIQKKSIALKSMYFGTKLNQAALTQDPSQIASVMNEMSPGYKFSAEIDKGTGSVTASVEGPDGRVVPFSYKSPQEMAAAAQSFASNGNVAATFQEQAKQAAEIALRGAQTKQADAQAGFVTANTKTEDATRTSKVEEGEAKVGLLGAQTAHQTALASKTVVDKLTPIEQMYRGLKAIGIDDDTARSLASGKGDKSKSREQLITDVATKLVDSNAKVIGATPLTMDTALTQATQLVDGAATAGGTSRVGSGSPVGRGITPPGAAAPKAGPGVAPARGMGAKAPQLPADEARAVADIKAAYKAGKLSREEATSQLQAFGFQ